MEPLPESPVAEDLPGVPCVKEMVALLEVPILKKVEELVPTSVLEKVKELVPESVVDKVKELVPESLVEKVAELVPESLVDKVKELVPESVVQVAAALSADQAALIKLVTDLVTSKPGTKEQALELFQKLQLQLGTWIVSELPAAEGKAMLMGLWAMEEMQKFNWKSCFGLK